MFDDLSTFQIWLLIGAVFATGFYMGRKGADASSESRAYRKRLAREESAHNFSRLSRETQAQIDRLAADGKIIDAVKLVRQALGTGLYEAKQVVDQRKRSAIDR